MEPSHEALNPERIPETGNSDPFLDEAEVSRDLGANGRSGSSLSFRFSVQLSVCDTYAAPPSKLNSQACLSPKL